MQFMKTTFMCGKDFCTHSLRAIFWQRSLSFRNNIFKFEKIEVNIGVTFSTKNFQHMQLFSVCHQVIFLFTVVISWRFKSCFLKQTVQVIVLIVPLTSTLNSLFYSCPGAKNRVTKNFCRTKNGRVWSKNKFLFKIT